MGRLEACCGGFHSCLREASGQSESGAAPAWLLQVCLQVRGLFKVRLALQVCLQGESALQL